MSPTLHKQTHEIIQYLDLISDDEDDDDDEDEEEKVEDEVPKISCFSIINLIILNI